MDQEPLYEHPIVIVFDRDPLPIRLGRAINIAWAVLTCGGLDTTVYLDREQVRWSFGDMGAWLRKHPAKVMVEAERLAALDGK